MIKRFSIYLFDNLVVVNKLFNNKNMIDQYQLQALTKFWNRIIHNLDDPGFKDFEKYLIKTGFIPASNFYWYNFYIMQNQTSGDDSKKQCC